MKKIVLILLLVVAGTTMAQNDEAFVEGLVTEFTEKLETRGITTWYYTKRYCIGTIEMFKMEDGSMCASKGTYYGLYLFWEEDNALMIKKIDNCGLYYSLPLGETQLNNFFPSNTEALASGAVKHYEAENLSDTPKLRTSVEPCSHYYKFNKDGDSFEKEFNLYSLTNDSLRPNINYKYNNGLKIVELDKILDEVISEVESKFRRQKQ